MVGIIRKRDILSHPLVTIRCFGWRVFFNSLFAGGNQTFLTLLRKSGVFDGKTAAAPKLVDASIQLELRAKRLYQLLTRRFAQAAMVRDFFATLSRQEQEHADLLKLCRTATGQEQWLELHLQPYAGNIPRLEEAMQEAESGLERIRTVSDALRLAIQLESSELNDAFRCIVAASDSRFVKSLGAFQAATDKHIQYICRTIPRMAPDLKESCQTLCGKNRPRAQSQPSESEVLSNQE